MSNPVKLPFVRGEKVCVALTVALFSCVVLFKAWNGGITVDEPSHLLSAAIYWRGGHTLPPRDMPPLIRIAGGWASRIWPLPIPADLGKKGDERQEWLEAVVMAEKFPDHAAVRRAFFPARASLLIFPIGILLLVWWWGRQLLDPWTGVAAAAFLALDPTFRGHSSLFKNDLASTFGYLLFWFAAWRYWQAPYWSRVWLLAGAATVALLAKLSMLVLIPWALVVVLARALPCSRPRWIITVGATLLAVIVPWATSIVVAPQEAGRLSGWEADHIRTQYESIPRAVTAAAALIQRVPISRPLWEGVISLFIGNSAESPNYLFGHLVPRGSPWFFLAAFAVKWPLPLLIFAVFGAVAFSANRPRTQTLAFILIPLAFYFTAISLASLQYGIRLALPCFPFLAIIAAAGLRWLFEYNGRILAGVLGAWLLTTSILAVPNEIAYFNEAVGGPANGLRYLADSNLDWGQALPQLHEEVSERGIKNFKLCYYGTDNPYRFFTDKQIERITPPWNAELANGVRVYVPTPGYYAISANMLPGHFFPPEYREFFTHFKNRAPFARAGDAIYLYKVD